MRYIEWFEERISYYKILYIFYGIISVTVVREIEYLTNVFSLFMVMLSFIYFCIFLIKGYYIKICNVRYWLIGFIIIQLSSFFISNNYIGDFIRLVFNFIFFFVLSMNTKKDKMKLENIFYWVINIIFPIVFISLITYYLKIKFIVGNNIYGKLDEYEGANKTLTGITINVNSLGVLAAILIILSIHILISGINDSSKKGYLFVTILIGSLTLFHTAARGAMLALIIYLVSLLLISIKNKWKSITLLLVMIILSFVFIDKLIISKGLEELSSGRSLLWIASMNVIIKNPIWGVGTTEFIEYVKNSTSTYLPGIDKGGLHNIYIQIATANGCIALILFLLFILSILCIGVKRVRRNEDLVGISLLSIIISFLALNLVESGLIYIMSFIALIFWVCIGEFIKNIELE